MEAQRLPFVWDVPNVDGEDCSWEHIDIPISTISLQPFHPMTNILKYGQGFSRRCMDANAIGREESTV